MGIEWKHPRRRSPMDTGGSSKPDRKLMAVVWTIAAGVTGTIALVAGVLVDGYTTT